MGTKKASEKAATQEAVASTVLAEIADILNLGPNGDVVETVKALKDKEESLVDHANEMAADLRHVARALDLPEDATREQMDAAITQLWDAQSNQNRLEQERTARDGEISDLRGKLDAYRAAIAEIETVLEAGAGEDVRAAARRVKAAADQPRPQSDEAVLADFGRRILRGEVSLCIHTQH